MRVFRLHICVVAGAPRRVKDPCDRLYGEWEVLCSIPVLLGMKLEYRVLSSSHALRNLMLTASKFTIESRMPHRILDRRWGHWLIFVTVIYCLIAPAGKSWR